ncbi:MAG TPA: SpoIID/LytB domain-containing protein [Bacteroidales bacterium]|nr:SpoIID/LytB domain-containing protein [Bacteroidales bacterium]HPS17864.1 SpoIID/LytB domain-containing protein [Bacteroidales bacterium]
MIKRISYIFVIIITFFSQIANAIDIDVCIYSSSEIKKVMITPLSGKYVIYSNKTKIADLYKNNPVILTAVGEKINISKSGEDLGTYSILSFSAEGFLNTFTLSPLEPNLLERVYDDGITISAADSILKIINKVDIEHYIAGVVESEGGIKKNLEYLKLQAIISRTYAISNIRKHLKESGFNLCDNVHCQLYKGRCTNSMIMMAVSQTAGDIIIDKTNKPISASFHSNCGGETVNSEDIWSIATSYLRSIKDTFCLKQTQAHWEKNIPTKEWLEYLAKKFSYPISDSSMVLKAKTFSQKERKINFNDNPNIPLKTIRTDWKLRSTYFSIEDKGDTLVFKGRGYGHGVGLCQEGAMHMVDLGWTFKNIIKYYYKDVSLVNISDLK